MTDKQITIDGVDVSECIFKNGYGCSAYSIGSLGCNVYPSCYYKQLKRLQAELETKEKEIEKFKEHQKFIDETNRILYKEKCKLLELLKKAKEGADAYEYCIQKLEKENEKLRGA